MLVSEFEKRFPDVYQSRLRDKYNAVFPNGESYKAMEARIIPVLESLDRAQGNNVVVSHQGTMRVMLRLLLGLEEQAAADLVIEHDLIYLVQPGAKIMQNIQTMGH